MSADTLPTGETSPSQIGFEEIISQLINLGSQQSRKVLELLSPDARRQAEERFLMLANGTAFEGRNLSDLSSCDLTSAFIAIDTHRQADRVEAITKEMNELSGAVEKAQKVISDIKAPTSKT